MKQEEERTFAYLSHSVCVCIRRFSNYSGVGKLRLVELGMLGRKESCQGWFFFLSLDAQNSIWRGVEGGRVLLMLFVCSF